MGSAIGSIVGGIAGSIIPGVGTALGASIGGGLGGMVGGKGGSKLTSGTNPSTKSNSSALPQIPTYMQADYDSLYKDARGLYNKDYPNYTGEGIAGFTPDQLAAFQGVRSSQGQYQPMYNSASNLAMMAGQGYQGGISQPELDQFMNPYQQNVIDIAKRQAQTDSDMQMAQLRSRQAGAGTYGGSRAALQESTMQNNSLRNLSDIQMTGSAANYNQAVTNIMSNRRGMLDASNGIANLATSGQNYNYRDLGALSAQGDQQQQHNQALDTYGLNTFQAEQAYPQDQFNWYNNFLQSMMGKTTNQVQVNDPGKPSPLNTALGVGSILGSGAGGLGNALSGLTSGISSLFSHQDTSPITWNDTSPITWFNKGGLVKGYADGGQVTFRDRMNKSLSIQNPLYKKPWTSGINIDFNNPDTPFERDVAGGLGSLSNYLKNFKEKGSEFIDYTSLGINDLVTSPFNNKVSNYFTGDNSPSTADLLAESDGITKLKSKGAKPAAGVASIVEDSNNFTPVPAGFYDKLKDDTTTPPLFAQSDPMGGSPSEDTVPEVDAKMDFNEPLFRMGAALLSTPGDAVVGWGKAATAYADAKDKEYERTLGLSKLHQDTVQANITNKLNKEKTASEINLQSAQVEKLRSDNKMAIEQLKSETRLSQSEEKNLYGLAQTYAQSGMFDDPMGQAIADMRKAKVQSALNFIKNKVLVGDAKPEEVKGTLTKEMVGRMYGEGDLTAEEAKGIIDTYLR